MQSKKNDDGESAIISTQLSKPIETNFHNTVANSIKTKLFISNQNWLGLNVATRRIEHWHPKSGQSKFLSSHEVQGRVTRFCVATKMEHSGTAHNRWFFLQNYVLNVEMNFLFPFWGNRLQAEALESF